MAGFPSAGGERKDGRVNYFIGKGIMRLFQTTTFGEPGGVVTQRLKILVKAFKKAGLPSVLSRRMDAWQKTHVAMVSCIAGALYMHDSNNYLIAKSGKDVRLMVRGIKEGFRVIESSGFKITPFKLNYFKLPTFLLTAVFMIILNTEIAEFAMAKHTVAAKEEMRVLQAEFDDLIKKSGQITPSIDRLREYVLC